MRYMRIVASAITAFGCGKAYTEVYGFVNLTNKEVVVKIKDPGGYNIQQVKPQEIGLEYGEYLTFRTSDSTDTPQTTIQPDEIIFLDFCFNYSDQKSPFLEFCITSTDVINFELSHKPEFQKERNYIVSQNFGVEQEQLVGQRISDSKQLGRAYMAIVLEPAKADGSQGIEKEKASTQEEDVNNDSAAEVDEVKYKNTTDEQHVVPCCQIY